MRFNLSFITFVASLSVLGVVLADCCGGGTCADGTDGTPCCGNGKCNIFCCNCDSGCRKETLQGCLALASETENLCLNMVECDGDPSACNSENFQCWSAYQTDVKRCGQEFPNGASKRDLGLFADGEGALISRATSSDNSTTGAANTTCSSSVNDLFTLADTDNSGNMSLAEYLLMVNWTTAGSLVQGGHVSQWVNYFYSFDANNDTVISLSEIS